MKDSTMNASKSHSRIGLVLLATVGVTSFLQVLLMISSNLLAAKGIAITEASWFRWLAAFVPLYVVGIPVGIWITRKVPNEQFESVYLNEIDLYKITCYVRLWGGLSG